MFVIFMSETLIQTKSENEEKIKIIIQLKKDRNRKKIKWDPKVIDNEHLGRKKSKCCCSWNPSQCKKHSNEDVKDLNIPGNSGKQFKNNH